MILPADASFLANPLGLYKPFIAVVLQGIRSRILPSSVQLIAGSFTAPILLYLVASAVFGFIVTVPLLAYETYMFVDPALTPYEKKSAYPFVLAFSLLFVVGAFFGFFLLTPLVVWGSLFFFGVTGAISLVRIDDFYNLVFFTTLASGFAFTMPVILVLLAKFGVLQPELMPRNRKYLWIITYVITGVITPEGNPISDILLFIPIIALLEGALFIARRYQRRSPEETVTGMRCSFCGGNFAQSGIFCEKCGRSRL